MEFKSGVYKLTCFLVSDLLHHPGKELGAQQGFSPLNLNTVYWVFTVSLYAKRTKHEKYV